MGVAERTAPARLPASAFDDFVADRPDDETWELIDGHFVMQAQPTFTHQVIAGNVERLLNNALEIARPELIAFQQPAIDLRQVSTVGGATYVPDVAVLEIGEVDGARAKSASCHLAVEIVSPSDRRPASEASRRPRIDVKVEGYRHLPSCEAILVIEQDRPGVTVHVRREGGWSIVERSAPDDVVELARFGVRCPIAAFYARTSVLRAARRP